MRKFRITISSAEIQTIYLTNTSLQHYCYTSLLGMNIIFYITVKITYMSLKLVTEWSIKCE